MPVNYYSTIYTNDASGFRSAAGLVVLFTLYAKPLLSMVVMEQEYYISSIQLLCMNAVSPFLKDFEGKEKNQVALIKYQASITASCSC